MFLKMLPPAPTPETPSYVMWDAIVYNRCAVPYLRASFVVKSAAMTLSYMILPGAHWIHAQ